MLNLLNIAFFDAFDNISGYRHMIRCSSARGGYQCVPDMTLCGNSFMNCWHYLLSVVRSDHVFITVGIESD